LVLLHGAQKPILVVAPLGGLAVEKHGIDASVELVDVRGVDARL
jgi:hypothetical protein